MLIALRRERLQPVAAGAGPQPGLGDEFTEHKGLWARGQGGKLEPLQPRGYQH